MNNTLKTLLTLIFVVGFSNNIHSQWLDNGGKITTLDTVGIGTSIPTKNLTLSAGSDLFFRIQKPVSQSYFDLGITSLTATIGYTSGTSTNSNLAFLTNGVSRMQITHDGKVGIGTSSPEETLQVNGTATIFGNIGIVDDSHWKTGEHTFELTNSDSGDVVLSFHRSGYSNASIRHSTEMGLTFSGNGFANTNHFHIQSDGKVGIGTSIPDEALTVKGKIHAEEIIVDLNVPAPDYVFDAEYELSTLAEIEAFIKANKHLPEIPSGAQMEDEGIVLGEMNMLLLKKIEELTLYMIDLKKENELLNERITHLEQNQN